MDLLLDTHALIWFLESDSRLSNRAKSLIQDANNIKYLSVASIWEMSIKEGLGKLNLKQPIANVITYIQERGVQIIPIIEQHALQAGRLTWHHRDPFDRMLITQSIFLNYPLVSKDLIFDRYVKNRMW